MTLLTMKFPEKLVDFALDRLGIIFTIILASHSKRLQVFDICLSPLSFLLCSPIDELVDFIAAAQLAEKYTAQSQDSLDCIESNESVHVVPVAARGHEVSGAFDFIS